MEIEVKEIRLISNRDIWIMLSIQVVFWIGFYFLSGGYAKDLANGYLG